MSDVPKSAEPRMVWVEPSIGCARCGSRVVLSGPVLRLPCSRCNNVLQIANIHWKPLFDYLDQVSFEEGEGSEGYWENPTASGLMECRYGVRQLACGACGTSMAHAEPGRKQILPCRSCNRRTITNPMPSWLRGLVPTALQTYGAIQDAERQRGEVRWWAYFQGTPSALAEQRQQEVKAVLQAHPDAARVSAPLSNPKPRKADQRLRLLMVVIVLGLAVYAAYKFLRSLRDPDDPLSTLSSQLIEAQQRGPSRLLAHGAQAYRPVDDTRLRHCL